MNLFAILSVFSGLLPVETTFPGRAEPLNGVLTEPPFPTRLLLLPVLGASTEDNLEEGPLKASIKVAIYLPLTDWFIACATAWSCDLPSPLSFRIFLDTFFLNRFGTFFLLTFLGMVSSTKLNNL